jgi:hypothetical protein
VPTKPPVDEPLIQASKRSTRLSSISTLRERDATNSHLQTKVPHMTWDFSKQVPLWPDRRKPALIEATHKDGAQALSGLRTLNRSGKPYALGVEIGGSPDPRNNTMVPSPKRKLTENPTNFRPSRKGK